MNFGEASIHKKRPQGIRLQLAYSPAARTSKPESISGHQRMVCEAVCVDVFLWLWLSVWLYAWHCSPHYPRRSPCDCPRGGPRGYPCGCTRGTVRVALRVTVRVTIRVAVSVDIGPRDCTFSGPYGSPCGWGQIRNDEAPAADDRNDDRPHATIRLTSVWVRPTVAEETGLIRATVSLDSQRLSGGSDRQTAAPITQAASRRYRYRRPAGNMSEPQIAAFT